MSDSDERNLLVDNVFPLGKRRSYLPFVIRGQAEITRAGGYISFLPSGVKTVRGDELKANIRATPEWQAWARESPEAIVDALCQRYRDRCQVPAGKRILPVQGASLGSKAIDDAGVEYSRGRHLLQPTLEYPVMREFAEQRGMPVVTCPQSELASHITRRTAMVYISVANNPTGRPLSPRIIDDVIDAARRSRQLRVVVDKAFPDPLHDVLRDKHADCEELVEIVTYAKGFGLSTLKCAFVIASPSIIEAIEESYQTLVGTLCIDPCIDALFVLDQLSELRAAAAEKIQQNKPAIEQGLRDLVSEGLIADVEPNGDVGIAFPRIVGARDTYTFCRRACLRHQAVLTPGCYFGDSSRVRLGWGALTPEEITEGIDRFRHALLGARDNGE